MSLQVEQRDRVAWLTLSRPEAANALSRELIARLRAELARLAGQAELAALVITGAGDRTFCAGADLKQRRGMSPDQVRAHLDEQGALMDDVAAFPRPVVAAINGAALGGGLELALACDLRLAVAGATLGLPEVRLGIIPAAGGTQRLARICGVAAAKELILTGRRIDAAEAARLGLLGEVAPAGGLHAAVERVLAELAQAGPLALAQAKRAIDGGLGLPLADALAWERRCYELVLASDDREEGLRAFVEKRPPRFRGR